MNHVELDLPFEIQGFSDRVREAMGAEKPTQFALRTGISQATVSKVWNSDSKKGVRLDIAAQFADGLGVALDWLVFGRGDGPVAETFMRMPHYDAALAVGATSWVEGRRFFRDVRFDADFICNDLGRRSAAGLSVIEARGDSMEPTIANGAHLVIDEDDQRIDDGVFAFVLGGMARARRIEARIDAVRLISDNKAYDPETIVRGDFAKLAVIGRVLWVGQRI